MHSDSRRTKQPKVRCPTSTSISLLVADRRCSTSQPKPRKSRQYRRRLKVTSGGSPRCLMPKHSISFCASVSSCTGKPAFTRAWLAARRIEVTSAASCPVTITLSTYNE